MSTAERSPGAVRTPDELRAMIGRPTLIGAWTDITQTMVDDFARVTGDEGPLHNDPEFAADTPYGGTIAQGFLTLCLLPYLSTRPLERVAIELPRRYSVNYGFDRIRFPAPVPVGRRARIVIRPLAVEEHEGHVQITNSETVEVESQDKPGLVATRLRRLYA